VPAVEGSGGGRGSGPIACSHRISRLHRLRQGSSSAQATVITAGIRVVHLRTGRPPSTSLTTFASTACGSASVPTAARSPTTRSVCPSCLHRSRQGRSLAPTTASAATAVGVVLPHPCCLRWRRHSRPAQGACSKLWASDGPGWFFRRRCFRWAAYGVPFSTVDVGSTGARSAFEGCPRSYSKIKKLSPFQIANNQIS
jgi:hypothetical protein